MPVPSDPHDLERFVAAQDGVFEVVRRELTAGRTRTRWSMCGHAGSDVLTMLGSPDHLKLRSCCTLFAAVADDPEPFDEVLATFFAGVGCDRTRDVLATWRGRPTHVP